MALNEPELALSEPENEKTKLFRSVFTALGRDNVLGPTLQAGVDPS